MRSIIVVDGGAYEVNHDRLHTAGRGCRAWGNMIDCPFRCRVEGQVSARAAGYDWLTRRGFLKRITQHGAQYRTGVYCSVLYCTVPTWMGPLVRWIDRYNKSFSFSSSFSFSPWVRRVLLLLLREPFHAFVSTLGRIRPTSSAGAIRRS